MVLPLAVARGLVLLVVFPEAEQICRLSKEVMLTEEDDRDTPPEEILEMIAKGARAQGKKDGETLFKEPNRPKAILACCKMAKRGDTVLFLGKGNEKTIERSTGTEPYYEYDEIVKALRKLR